jgi:hypothetical protein
VSEVNRRVIGQVTITQTTEDTYDVFEDDWDFDPTEGLPNEDDMQQIAIMRGPRLTIDDIEWEWHEARLD